MSVRRFTVPKTANKRAEALDKPGPCRLETCDHYEMSFYGCLNSR
jgi:hypothetical protein